MSKEQTENWEYTNIMYCTVGDIIKTMKENGAKLEITGMSDMQFSTKRVDNGKRVSYFKHHKPKVYKLVK